MFGLIYFLIIKWDRILTIDPILLSKNKLNQIHFHIRYQVFTNKQ